jgi:nicotinamide phosphoribosyltransferase
MNIITATDFYKTGHAPMFPMKTKRVYSNWTPRSIKYAGTKKVTVIGIQALILKRFIKEFNDTFFSMDEDKAVRKYKRRMDNAMGPGVINPRYIRELHKLGYLPLHVKALPEGVEVSPKIPVMTMVNTLDDFYWLTNYLETITSGELWLPMTSASTARQYRRILTRYAELTGTPAEFVNVQGHDFSCRGMYPEAAAASGFGHLCSFWGTDTISAIDFAEDWYFADSDKEMIGCSVPATEHSVMCMGGQEDEIETFRRLINDYPVGIISIVSDTWDFWKVMTEMAPALKEEIRARKAIRTETLIEVPESIGDPEFYAKRNGATTYKFNGRFFKDSIEITEDEALGAIVVPGKTVFRPDSGCPVKILTGYKVFTAEMQERCRDKDLYSIEQYAQNYGFEAIEFGNKTLVVGDLNTELQECEVKGAVEVLWDGFGGTLTETGHKQLQEVGLIYGDSITLERAEQILERLHQKGFASGNVVLGIGSFTYQYVTRDTYGFAMKATWGRVGDEAREIMKDPKTDDGTKKSNKGLLRVELEDGEYVVYDQQTEEQEKQGELKTVFLDGVLTRKTTLADIRARIQS